MKTKLTLALPLAAAFALAGTSQAETAKLSGEAVFACVFEGQAAEVIARLYSDGDTSLHVVKEDDPTRKKRYVYADPWTYQSPDPVTGAYRDDCRPGAPEGGFFPKWPNYLSVGPGRIVDASAFECPALATDCRLLSHRDIPHSRDKDN